MSTDKPISHPAHFTPTNKYIMSMVPLDYIILLGTANNLGTLPSIESFRDYLGLTETEVSAESVEQIMLASISPMTQFTVPKELTTKSVVESVPMNNQCKKELMAKKWDTELFPHKNLSGGFLTMTGHTYSFKNVDYAISQLVSETGRKLRLGNKWEAFACLLYGAQHPFSWVILGELYSDDKSLCWDNYRGGPWFRLRFCNNDYQPHSLKIFVVEELEG